ncbi:hypothetical protein [Candidatus Mycobacterium methanotrophicum]|uniref:Uncharacterized protein n=1 Tax=Candidatus Mycobacterium methanotrophicum TaxID=2943498 RepID=A0ABY4QKH2_9MYCO|nr:hypothetical protein [Candidatus Mycobacterium methanotrophicum]UQX10341.1 hypothetical protein M5I08_19770 [Candidatus Mycobacterium methanotrophicum]
MTETSQKTVAERLAGLSDDVLESLETGRTTAIEAVRKFVDEVTPVVAEPGRRKKVVDAALDLAEELVKVRIEFLRSVVRSAGQTLSKE